MPETTKALTAAILTLGCKLNIADSEAMSRRLRAAGWHLVDSADGADAVIVNSCTVTQNAERDSKQALRKARRSAPNAFVGYTGCAVETSDLVTLDQLPADLIARKSAQATLVDRIVETRPALAPGVLQPASLRTRGFVAAQEGCNDVCAFCIIPRTRGRERSKSIDAVVEEVLAFEAEGVKEVVITGTQLGAYGRDRGPRELASLIAALLAGTKVPRIRISSVQPQDLSPALIELWSDARLCRHFHLALQSGSEATLQRMRRRYSADQYRRAVSDLRTSIPGIAITTDVIAGFPGETEAEFEETYAFCEEMDFASMHVFPYSQREGTLAARMGGQVADATKKERVRRLIELGARMGRAFRASLIGSELDVLFETPRADGDWEGLTDTYVRVHAASMDNLHNHFRRVRIVAAGDNHLTGEVIPQ